MMDDDDDDNEEEETAEVRSSTSGIEATGPKIKSLSFDSSIEAINDWEEMMDDEEAVKD